VQYRILLKCVVIFILLSALWRFSPSEFLSQDLEIGRAPGLQQCGHMTRARDAYFIVLGKRQSHFAINSQVHGNAAIVDLDNHRLYDGAHNGPLGERMGADWGDDDAVQAGIDYGTARGH
jgi:hypothetical protein